MRYIKLNKNAAVLESDKYSNSALYQKQRDKQKSLVRKLQWLFVILLMLGYVVTAFSQTGIKDYEIINKSEFEPTIKDAVKLGDLPEIKDTVKKISNINYGIQSTPLVSKYEVIPID